MFSFMAAQEVSIKKVLKNIQDCELKDYRNSSKCKVKDIKKKKDG